MWSRFKRISGGPKLADVPALTTEDGVTSSTSAKADLLFKRFIPRLTAPDDDSLLRQATTWKEVHDWAPCRAAEQISFDDLEDLVAPTRHGAAGLDKIPTLCIQKTFYTIGDILLDIFNFCLTNAYFPSCCRQSLVVPVPKGGSDPTKPSSWRPISLLCCMGKLLERIIQKQLTRHLENNGSICTEQHGFRSRRSTLTALIQANKIFWNPSTQETRLLPSAWTYPQLSTACRMISSYGVSAK